MKRKLFIAAQIVVLLIALVMAGATAGSVGNLTPSLAVLDGPGLPPSSAPAAPVGTSALASTSEAPLSASAGSSFTYQGSLKSGANPVTGDHDFRFRLYDDPAEGVQVGVTVTIDSVLVTEGVFTVYLDFGAGVFNGDARYLEVDVRQSGGGSYITLSPRQPISPAPYALFALKTQLYKNMVVVAKSGGDFTTITAALTSITEASATNRYLVWVGPGVYEEQVTMEQYVDMEGAGEKTTKITSTGSDDFPTSTLVGASNAELRSLTVEIVGSYETSTAIFNNNASPSLLNVIVSAYGPDVVGVNNTNTSSPSMNNVTVEVSSGQGFSTGIRNNNSSPSMNDVTVSVSGVQSGVGVSNVGSSSPKIVGSISATASDPQGSSYGVSSSVTSTSTVTIDNSKVSGGTNSVYNAAGGTTRVGASQLSGGPVFNEGTLTCSESYDGNNKRLGAQCTRNTKVAIVGLTDGDYTTITAALNDVATWCGAPSASNKCLVRVGPGTYTERVTMVQYVDIEGAGEKATKITYPGSPGTGTIVGASNAELRSLTVESSGGDTVEVAIAIYNNSASPGLLHVTVVASNASINNWAVHNINSSSPNMNNVTSTAFGSGEASNFGVSNGSGSSPVMNNVTASGSGGSLSIGVINSSSSSPTMNNVTASASGGSSNNHGIENSNASPTMNNVTASASGGSNNRGVYNTNSSSPAMTNVKATASGGSGGNTGIDNAINSSPTMNNVTAIASGGTNNWGIYNSINSSPIMNNVTATASGGSSNNYGVYNFRSSPKIVSSVISATEGARNEGVYTVFTSTVSIDSSKITVPMTGTTIVSFSGATTRVGASQLSGGAVFIGGGTLTCSASYDENYVSPGLNACP